MKTFVVFSFSGFRRRAPLRVAGPRVYGPFVLASGVAVDAVHIISCGFENPADASFCGECAAPLASTLSCPSCGKANPAKQKFCNGCGRPLKVSTNRSASPDPRTYTPKHLADKILQSKFALEGELKQVTVLCADVKGDYAAAARASDCLRVSWDD